MTVEADPRGVGEVGAEFDEQGAEVLVDLGAAMDLEEGGDAAASLQPRLIQVQIQPVDPFEVQGDMIFQHSATVWSTMIAGPG